MIVTNALICHIPIVVLVYGSNSDNPAPFIRPYSIYEKVQITIFFIQEVIISGLYIWAAWTTLEPSGTVFAKDLRKTMKHLIWINVVIILLDLTILATEYSGLYEIQVMYKGALYSAKLKLEFYILNQLVSLTKATRPGEWSVDTTSQHQSSGHDLRTVKHRQSTSPLDHILAEAYSARIGRSEEAEAPDLKSGIVMETFIEVTEAEVSIHLESESDQLEKGSLQMNWNTEAPSKAMSSSSSHVGLAR
jgi:hypothetical protein